MGIRMAAVTIGAALGLSACGGGAEPGDFAAACNAQGSLSPELCSCLEEQAVELSPDTYEYVIARVAEDEARATELEGDLDRTELLEARQFIAIGIQQCIVDLPTTPEPDALDAEGDEAAGDAAAPADEAAAPADEAAAPAEDEPAAEEPAAAE